jgi:hypothetical protein
MTTAMKNAQYGIRKDSDEATKAESWENRAGSFGI